MEPEIKDLIDGLIPVFGGLHSVQGLKECCGRIQYHPVKVHELGNSRPEPLSQFDATQPAWASDTGTTCEARLAAMTDNASSSNCSSPNSPPAGPDSPCPRQSNARVRR